MTEPLDHFDSFLNEQLADWLDEIAANFVPVIEKASVTYRGATITIPKSPDNWPVAFWIAQEHGLSVSIIRGILGPTQFDRVCLKLTLREFNQPSELMIAAVLS